MTDDLAWTFTYYRHALDARRGVRVTMGRDELAANMADAAPMRGPKSDLPLVCLATFEGNHRGNARVERVSMLGLDIDVPQADPGDVAARIARTLGDVEVFVYSTASSLPGAFRLRALVPYDVPATGDEYRTSWAMVKRLLACASVEIDRACCDPARGFYVWAVPPNGAYASVHIDGSPWPAAHAARVEAERLAAEEAERARSRPAPPQRSAGEGLSVLERARRYVDRMPVAIQGSDGSGATFAVARKLVADFNLSDDDAMSILREYSARCQPPWSERELLHKIASAKRARVRVEMNRR